MDQKAGFAGVRRQGADSHHDARTDYSHPSPTLAVDYGTTASINLAKKHWKASEREGDAMITC